MDFAQGREEFVEEDDQMVMHDRIRKHQQPNFTYSSSSPSSLNLMTNNAQMGSWLGTRFDPGEDNNSRSSPDHNNPEPARQEPGEDYASIEKEHMFDKVVTPSDVGKLNRLVIPKQHAEKYFPLDSSTNEKGLLLNFEDRDGKPWRFRYSYWNSSQSYVMTKGWSRFVKEKKLDAGDIVSFQRGVGEAAKDRLFIDWRRRPDSLPVGPHDSVIPGQYYRSIQYPWPASATSFPPSQILYRPGTVMMARDRLQLSQLGNVNVHSNNNSNNNNNSYMVGGTGYGYGNVVYLRSNAAVAAAPPPVRGVGSSVVFESVPVVQGKATAKRLRLFGVNMDCPISESDEECEILSSTSISHGSMVAPPPSIQFSSPAATQQQYPIPHPAVQLRLYNGMPLMSSKGKQASRSSSSSMSLDLDIN